MIRAGASMGYWDNFRVDRPGPKYRAICAALAEAIELGDLPPEKRLPSHRMLAKRLGVAVGTITRAYAEALDRGLISGEVGRGSYVREHPPTTITMPEARRMEIADIAKRHDVLIVEDESASFLLPDPPLPISA